MFYSARFILILISVSLLFASVSAGQGAETVKTPETRINSIIAESGSSGAVWSMAVRSPENQLVLNINADRLQRIASNSKLFIVAALMQEPGVEHRLETQLYGDGYLDNEGIWHGDLHFKGAGDPSFDEHFYDSGPFTVFDSFIEQIKAAGIQEIRGNIFGNIRLFDDQPYPPGWEWNDLSFYYAPELSALSFNGNCVDLSVQASGEIGDRPEISWFPYDTDYVQFVNEQRITPENISYNESYERILGSNTILLRSTLPQGYLETECLSVADPAGYFLDSFRKHAARNGILQQGSLIVDRIRRPWEEYRLLASHRSEPLLMMLERVNKKSDNLYAEMLTKVLSARRFGHEGSTESGLELIKGILRQETQIDTSRVQLRDASGMSSANISNAYVISSLLHNMYYSEQRQNWLTTLPLAGHSGSIRHRFLRSPLYGNLYAKTGFITGVRTLSGYFTAQSGRVYSFSLLTNNYLSKTKVIDQLHEQILNELYEML